MRKSPFCSLSAALRKLLHPHLRIHAKSNRPSVHSRPSVRTSVRLSSPIIARQRCTAAAFFRSPPPTPTPRTHPPPPYRFPGYNFSFQRCICPRDAAVYHGLPSRTDSTSPSVYHADRPTNETKVQGIRLSPRFPFSYRGLFDG